jgi:hypothetical protein
MDMARIPRPGQIYNHFKNKPYQIITVATHAETQERMVVYQALYGDYKAYIRPLENFLSEVDHEKYPLVTQKYRFELCPDLGIDCGREESKPVTAEIAEKSRSDNGVIKAEEERIVKYVSQSIETEAENTSIEQVNTVLLQFLDAESYYKKLEVITSNRKHMNDRLINDMAVALDCAIDEGPLDQRIQGLINCLQAMCRFEDKRLR